MGRTLGTLSRVTATLVIPARRVEQIDGRNRSRSPHHTFLATFCFYIPGSTNANARLSAATTHLLAPTTKGRKQNTPGRSMPSDTRKSPCQLEIPAPHREHSSQHFTSPRAPQNAKARLSEATPTLACPHLSRVAKAERPGEMIPIRETAPSQSSESSPHHTENIPRNISSLSGPHKTQKHGSQKQQHTCLPPLVKGRKQKHGPGR